VRAQRDASEGSASGEDGAAASERTATSAGAGAGAGSSPDRDLLARFIDVRAATLDLCEPLELEDFVVQSMPEASPARWHLAHTSWFFEEFVLRSHLRGYGEFHPAYRQLFNSYYESVGPSFARARRGTLSRPTVEEVLDYRQHVEAGMQRLLESRAPSPALLALVELGLQHEQQHQELLLTDIKHAFFSNPLRPAYRQRPLGTDPGAHGAVVPTAAASLQFREFAGGMQRIGHRDAGFAFDNEEPRHSVFLQPFRLGERLVTNGEFRDFVESGGYRDPSYWLAEGWTRMREAQWQRPIYWSADCEGEFTLYGMREIQAAAPVCHLSLYEADAYANAVGARLPTEQEWEVAATPGAGAGLAQMFDVAWQWTRSAYAPYPGFRALPGRVGEYNGKFMANQFVLRGGSCATPRGHVRATYRNYFPPDARWQFAGIRLAQDQ
jgi:ergothioneine biosynthesis protein EgtB